MSTTLELLLAQANAPDVKDQTKTTTYEPNLPEIGKCPARFVGYVELGTHPQRAYPGDKKEKKPAREVKVIFECFGPKNTTEVEVDGKTVKRGRLLTIGVTEGTNSKSNFKKMFDLMVSGRPDIKHMSQMLGQVFLLTVTHSESKDGKKKYANAKTKEAGWQIGGPISSYLDPETGEEKHIDLSKSTPAMSVAPRLFLVDSPSMEQWASIFIEGTYERTVKNDAGEDTTLEVSKNWMQEMLRTSNDWAASKMYTLLEEAGEDTSVPVGVAALDEEDADAEEEEVAEEPVAPVKAPAKKAATAKAPAKAAEPAVATKAKAAKAPVENVDQAGLEALFGTAV